MSRLINFAVVQIICALAIFVLISSSNANKISFPWADFNSAPPKQQINQNRASHHGSSNDNEPLILTPFIKSGDFAGARKAAKVSHPDFEGIESYSGYLTVDEKCGSNLFFWFFPSTYARDISPVVLWLQGGPGGSSLYGSLYENGPIRLLDNGKAVKSNYSWTEDHSMLYIDNPVGVGFSFTDQDCYAKDQDQVGRDLYNALTQFFQLFSDFQKPSFFIAGESYAGKYIPATAHKILKSNPSAPASQKINLKGIIIGDGLVDTINQHRYSPYLYELGLIDDDGKRQMEELEQNLTKAIEAENWDLATQLDEELIMGGQSSLYYKLTGLDISYNYVTGDKNDFPVLNDYLNQESILKALHVGDKEYEALSVVVNAYLTKDIVKSVAPLVSDILSEIPVLLYNGQLDIIVAYPLTRDFVNKLQFAGKAEFDKAERFVWRVENSVAGYVRQGGNLTLALVRNAGHMVPADQPKWIYDLLLGFTQPQC